MINTTAPPTFVLWREVLFAYAAPALCAGIGGLVTGQHDLLLAAATSIAGTSAVVAALVGIWLQRNRFRRGWLARTTPVLLTAGFAIGAAALAALIAWLTTESSTLVPERIRIDFPIAAALAATITTWRWRAAQRRAQQ
ncbi:hypothetical protein ACQPW1_21105 [Nocardia sp. CA-128927]|uniref:hypothetical protein n=1 Tax=Nocardia sp. CA-128927 TaxID=3239975 RepID=UPI003D963776